MRAKKEERMMIGLEGKGILAKERWMVVGWKIP
jgi:hypothetical protein